MPEAAQMMQPQQPLPPGLSPEAFSKAHFLASVYIRTTAKKRKNKERETGKSRPDSNVRIPIWNRSEQRKTSGFASPLFRNLAKYLAEHPECEVYDRDVHGKLSQDKRRADEEDDDDDDDDDYDLSKGKKRGVGSQSSSRRQKVSNLPTPSKRSRKASAVQAHQMAQAEYAQQYAQMNSQVMYAQQQQQQQQQQQYYASEHPFHNHPYTAEASPVQTRPMQMQHLMPPQYQASNASAPLHMPMAMPIAVKPVSIFHEDEEDLALVRSHSTRSAQNELNFLSRPASRLSPEPDAHLGGLYAPTGHIDAHGKSFMTPASTQRAAMGPGRSPSPPPTSLSRINSQVAGNNFTSNNSQWMKYPAFSRVNSTVATQQSTNAPYTSTYGSTSSLVSGLRFNPLDIIVGRTRVTSPPADISFALPQSAPSMAMHRLSSSSPPLPTVAADKQSPGHAVVPLLQPTQQSAVGFNASPSASPLPRIINRTFRNGPTVLGPVLSQDHAHFDDPLPFATAPVASLASGGSSPALPNNRPVHATSTAPSNTTRKSIDVTATRQSGHGLLRASQPLLFSVASAPVVAEGEDEAGTASPAQTTN
jgi:hypothetical protein